MGGELVPVGPEEVERIRRAVVELRVLGLPLLPAHHPGTPLPTGWRETHTGKRPALAKWTQRQTRRPTPDEERTDFEKLRNPGMPTGAMSRVVVLDLDDAEAIEWADANVPATPVRSRSGSGNGEHRFYRFNPDRPIGNKARLRTPDGRRIKADIRGQGGFILLPGARHVSGGLYEMVTPWTVEALANLPELPEELIAGAILAPPPAPEFRYVGNGNLPEVVERARAYLAKVPPAVEGDGGDQRTFAAAAVLVKDFALPEDEAWLVLTEWNLRCSPPWSTKDLRQKLRNAAKYARGTIGSKADALRPTSSSRTRSSALTTAAASTSASHSTARPTTSTTSAPEGMPDHREAAEWIELQRGEETDLDELPPAAILAELEAAIPPRAERADGAGEQLDEQIEKRIATEMDRERVRREARRRLAAEEREKTPPLEFVSLADLLATPMDPIAWRVEQWLPVRFRALLAAQFKSGKTTAVENLVRSLVDGDLFLGSYCTHPVAGKVALIDTEMGERQLTAWFQDQGIRSASKVHLVSLRGRVAALDLLDSAVRAQWATRLREAGVSFVILDCLRPVLDALGLDEHREAGRFLVVLDALLEEAGVGEALVVHHMGHQGERSRGDSRLRDWPDVEWRLIREGEDPASPRYLTAYGRDVDQPEQRLAYDPTSRRLTLGGGSRKDAKADPIIGDVLEVLREQGSLSQRKIEAALRDNSEAGRDAIRDALHSGVRRGVLDLVPGPRKSKLYSAPADCASARECADAARAGE